MTDYVIVYNTTDDSVQIDEDGHMCAPRTWRTVARDEVQDHIAGGRLIEIDPGTINKMSNPEAWEAKQEYNKVSAESVEAKTDYDKSTEEATADRKGSQTKRR